MNDVTSMLYVSLVRQFETLLFYVVTSRIEAIVVSRHKFLNACVEKVYHLLLQLIVYCRFHLCIWMELQIFSHNPVHRFSWHIREKCGQIRDGEASVFANFHLNLLYEIGSHDAGATAAFVVVHFQIACTIVKPYCQSSLLLHRPHTLACEYRLVGYSWPVEIGWLHGSQCALPYFNNSNMLLPLATAIRTWRTSSGMFAK